MSNYTLELYSKDDYRDWKLDLGFMQYTIPLDCITEFDGGCESLVDSEEFKFQEAREVAVSFIDTDLNFWDSIFGNLVNVIDDLSDWLLVVFKDGTPVFEGIIYYDDSLSYDKNVVSFKAVDFAYLLNVVGELYGVNEKSFTATLKKIESAHFLGNSYIIIKQDTLNVKVGETYLFVFENKYSNKRTVELKIKYIEKIVIYVDNELVFVLFYDMVGYDEICDDDYPSHDDYSIEGKLNLKSMGRSDSELYRDSRTLFDFYSNGMINFNLLGLIEEVYFNHNNRENFIFSLDLRPDYIINTLKLPVYFHRTICWYSFNNAPEQRTKYKVRAEAITINAQSFYVYIIKTLLVKINDDDYNKGKFVCEATKLSFNKSFQVKEEIVLHNGTLDCENINNWDFDPVEDYMSVLESDHDITFPLSNIAEKASVGLRVEGSVVDRSLILSIKCTTDFLFRIFIEEGTKKSYKKMFADYLNYMVLFARFEGSKLILDKRDDFDIETVKIVSSNNCIFDSNQKLCIPTKANFSFAGYSSIFNFVELENALEEQDNAFINNIKYEQDIVVIDDLYNIKLNDCIRIDNESVLRRVYGITDDVFSNRVKLKTWILK